MQDLRILADKNLRDNGMDLISGILILYMVLVHLFQAIDIYKGNILYYMQFLNFYMPWFFYKGGKFFKADGIKYFSLSEINRLLIPYVKYSIVGYFVYCICLFIKGDYNYVHYLLTPIKSLVLSGSIPGNEPLWFLLTLFLIRQLARYIIRNINKSFHITIIVFLFLVGYIMNFLDIYKPDYLLNITTGLGFFLAGYKSKHYIYKSPIIYIGCYIMLCLFSFSSVEMRHNILERGYYLLWPLCSIIGMEKSEYAVTANEPKNESDIPIRSISTLHWISINYEMPYIGFRFKIGACCYTCAKRHKTSIRNRSMLLQS